VPREELIDFACVQLLGEISEEDGHYITVWAPRQRGKTWIMQQVMQRIRQQDAFEVAILSMQSAKNITTEQGVRDLLVRNLRGWFRRDFPDVPTWGDLHALFSAANFTRPLILILDEFDALAPAFIDAFANEFRDMYIRRRNEIDKPSAEKECLLHGLALVGVRAVLGVENQSGSPFNVQRSLHIPNLTEAEVNAMYHWYERESGQTVAQAVIDRVFYETQGQPGLVSWLGELLTETYNPHPDQPITMADFERVYTLALHALPNNNLLNIISKARRDPYKETVLELFRTQEDMAFRYEDPLLNFLYLNGVIDWGASSEGPGLVVKFPCPLVQKRLFHYFAGEIVPTGGRLYDPFADLSDTITEETLCVPALLRRCETYFRENRSWLFRAAPRRADLRLYEAVYHFNLYAYIRDFLRRRQAQVWPEFPTGNGKVDLIVRYAGQVYAIEVKSFTDAYEYRESLRQAAKYAQQLGLTAITLALFVEAVDDANRAKFEVVYVDAETGVTVRPVFVETGE
jgi:Holliday junction resolvase-like predicted endonuclease